MRPILMSTAPNLIALGQSKFTAQRQSFFRETRAGSAPPRAVMEEWCEKRLDRVAQTPAIHALKRNYDPSPDASEPVSFL